MKKIHRRIRRYEAKCLWAGKNRKPADHGQSSRRWVDHGVMRQYYMRWLAWLQSYDKRPITTGEPMCSV